MTLPVESEQNDPALITEMEETLRAGLEHAIPFNLHNGVRILEVGSGRGVATLPEARHLENHLGTQHGGALLAVAEAAAGAAYVGAFVDHLAENVVDGVEGKGGVPSWLLTTGALIARQQGTSMTNVRMLPIASEANTRDRRDRGSELLAASWWRAASHLASGPRWPRTLQPLLPPRYREAVQACCHRVGWRLRGCGGSSSSRW